MIYYLVVQSLIIWQKYNFGLQLVELMWKVTVNLWSVSSQNLLFIENVIFSSIIPPQLIHNLYADFSHSLKERGEMDLPCELCHIKAQPDHKTRKYVTYFILFLFPRSIN